MKKRTTFASIKPSFGGLVARWPQNSGRSRLRHSFQLGKGCGCTSCHLRKSSAAVKAPEVKAPEATEFLAMLAEEEQDVVLVALWLLMLMLMILLCDLFNLFFIFGCQDGVLNDQWHLHQDIRSGVTHHLNIQPSIHKLSRAFSPRFQRSIFLDSFFLKSIIL